MYGYVIMYGVVPGKRLEDHKLLGLSIDPTVAIKTHDSESRGQEEAQQRDH